MELTRRGLMASGALGLAAGALGSAAVASQAQASRDYIVQRAGWSSTRVGRS